MERPKKPPKWQAHVDKMSPWFAMGLAPALQPWVLISAGAATVVEAKLSSAGSYLALFLFCVPASASYLATDTAHRTDRNARFSAPAAHPAGSRRGRQPRHYSPL